MTRTGTDIRSLTGLRGLAATWVVLYHLYQSQNPLGRFSQLLRHGYLAVDIFFVLSGFVMALSYGAYFSAGFNIRHYATFLLRRFARVWPLYAVMTLLFALSIVVGRTSGRITPSALVSLLPVNLAMIQTWGIGATIDQPAWSISTELAAYLLFPLLAVPTLFWRNSATVLTCLASIVTLAMLAMFAQQSGVGNGPLDLWVPTTPWPVVRCTTEFSLGMATYRFSAAPECFPVLMKPAVTLLILVCFFLLLMAGSTDFSIIVLVPLIIFLAVKSAPLSRVLGLPVFHYLGEVSYAIYLLHWALLPVRRALLAHLHMVGLLPEIIVSLVFWSTLLAAATLAHRFIEVPGRRWIRHLDRILIKIDPRDVQKSESLGQILLRQTRA